MVFPESSRVIYKNNTLAIVICQLRFPPILRIQSDSPADFQDRIRGDYPLFNDKHAPDLPQGVPPELARILLKELPGSGVAQYEFTSADEKWTVSLTKEFLALTARQYERWEDFKAHLQVAQESLIEIYRPTFFSRIGLRYRNVICRSALELGSEDWLSLLQPHILGELSVTELSQRVRQTQRETLIELDGDGQVRIKHGLAENQGSDEQVYVIDADYFSEKQTEASDVINTLDQFNRESGRLFRWCITDRLHCAMEPQPVE